MRTMLICQFCGRHFDAYRSDARYCSPKCRKAGSRRNKNINNDGHEHFRRQRDYDMFHSLLKLSLDDKSELSDLYAKKIKPQSPEKYRIFLTDCLRRLRTVCTKILKYHSGDMVDRRVLYMFFQEFVILSEQLHGTEVSEGVGKIRAAIDECIYPLEKGYYWSLLLNLEDVMDDLEYFSELDPDKIDI